MKASSHQRFYISCTLGFEENLAEEIRECWPWLIELNGQANQQPVPELHFEKGGVLIEVPLEIGLQLNYFLKSAHRILLRISEFKVRDFPKLFEKIQKIPWNTYLASTKVQWVVAASKSRLNHEKRIQETCEEAFAKTASKIQGTSPATQDIYVRLFDDLCSISLDTSGENLHKRGWGAFKGEAPLRETLAAFLIRQLIGSASPGYLQKVTIVDPMCGSGTLLSEAASLWQPVFQRSYSFLEWKNTPKIFKTPLFVKNYKRLHKGTPFKAYRGYDIDEKVLQAAQQNFSSLKAQADLGDVDIQFQKESLFEGEKKDLGPVWCISNPPYGERLHVQGQKEFSFQELLNTMALKFSAEKIAVLLPNKGLLRSLKAPPGYQVQTEIPFSNGGLDVVLKIYCGAP